MKNILITGATGFLGSRLADLMKAEYKDKANIILLTSRKIDGHVCILHQEYGYQTAAFESGGVSHVDIVIHAGWFVAKKPTEKTDMIKNFSPLVNTHYLLNHLPNIPKKIIFCSSTDVYGGTGTEQAYEKGCMLNEESPISLVTLYGLAKYNTELLVSDWAKKRGCSCQILRLGPLYGPGDLRKDYLVGAMLKKAAMGEKLLLYADKNMRRNLLYVDDCCQFIMNSIDLADTPEINIVSSFNPTMMEIMEAICKAADYKAGYEVVSAGCKGKDLIYDSSRRAGYLGEERYSLEDGMRAALKWNIEYYCSSNHI